MMLRAKRALALTLVHTLSESKPTSAPPMASIALEEVLPRLAMAFLASCTCTQMAASNFKPTLSCKWKWWGAREGKYC